MAFFLNIYQAMYVHQFLRLVEEQQMAIDDGESQDFLTSLKNMFKGSNRPFKYRLGPYDFTLEEIKHGLLRNNRRPPDAFLSAMSSTDERLGIISGIEDPRLNFICLDSPNFVEHIDPIEGNNLDGLDRSIQDYVSEFLNEKVKIDLDEKEITLPHIMDAYRKDFGDGTDVDLVSFVLPYLDQKLGSEDMLL